MPVLLTFSACVKVCLVNTSMIIRRVKRWLWHFTSKKFSFFITGQYDDDKFVAVFILSLTKMCVLTFLRSPLSLRIVNMVSLVIIDYKCWSFPFKPRSYKQFKTATPSLGLLQSLLSGSFMIMLLGLGAPLLFSDDEKNCLEEIHQSSGPNSKYLRSMHSVLHAQVKTFISIDRLLDQKIGRVSWLTAC